MAQLQTPNLTRGMMEQVMLLAIREMRHSVTLADPDLPDCPLIGCSDGFQTITGYRRNEILGRNCRFLNEGTELEVRTREALRKAAISGQEFIGVLPNRRADGELFQNLLHMTTLKLQGKRYIIGVQADVTNSNFDKNRAHHINEIRSVSEQIFSKNIDAWVHMQAQRFSIKVPLPYSELLKKYSPDQYAVAQRDFIAVAGCEAAMHLQKLASGPGAAHLSDSPESTTATDSGEVVETEDDSAFSTDCGPVSSSAGEGKGTYSVHSALSSDEALLMQEPGMKSIGSVGHPDGCTECQFFFFHPGGCRSGVSCRYCHEIHLRRSSKKNRRLLKRMQDRDSIPEEVNSGHGADKETPSEACPLGLRYPAAPGRGYGAEQRLTFAVGQELRLPAVLEADEAKRKALRACLLFEVSPPLPPGLFLDARSGEIAGKPSQDVERETYAVTVSTQARGPGGVKLGVVTLATCHLSLRVVDLQCLRPCSVREDDGLSGQGRAGNLVVEFCAGGGS